MATFTVRRIAEVPQPSRVSRAVREQQLEYERFIDAIDNEVVGELELCVGETIRTVKVRLRRASTRLALKIEVWDADGKVYFSKRPPGRGRPRKRQQRLVGAGA